MNQSAASPRASNGKPTMVPLAPGRPAVFLAGFSGCVEAINNTLAGFLALFQQPRRPEPGCSPSLGGDAVVGIL